MKTFTDIFKKGFLEETGNLTIQSFFMSLIAAFICCMIIYVFYRKFHKGVIYNNNFNILLVMTGMVSCFVVMVISSNVVLSLGMVGSLSIVRFRSAVKNPLDVGFLFWTVGVGITCGAGLYLISFGATIFIALVYLLLISIRSRKRVFLLVIKYKSSAYEEVVRIIDPIQKQLKNRNVTGDLQELTYEIKMDENNTSFVTALSELEGVINAAVVEFTGDFGE